MKHEHSAQCRKPLTSDLTSLTGDLQFLPRRAADVNWEELAREVITDVISEAHAGQVGVGEEVAQAVLKSLVVR